MVWHFQITDFNFYILQCIPDSLWIQGSISYCCGSLRLQFRFVEKCWFWNSHDSCTLCFHGNWEEKGAWHFLHCRDVYRDTHSQMYTQTHTDLLVVDSLQRQVVTPTATLEVTASTSVSVSESEIQMFSVYLYHCLLPGQFIMQVLAPSGLSVEERSCLRPRKWSSLPVKSRTIKTSASTSCIKH